MQQAHMPLTFVRSEREENHRSVILMGVVRHEVKISAGSSGLWGRISLGPHAASKMILVSSHLGIPARPVSQDNGERRRLSA